MPINKDHHPGFHRRRSTRLAVEEHHRVVRLQRDALTDVIKAAVRAGHQAQDAVAPGAEVPAPLWTAH